MLAAAIAAHATVLGGGLIWLDHAHIEAGLALRPPAEWLALFREPFAGTGYYRPLTALSLSIDALFGSVAAYHLTNLALHAAAALGLVHAAQALGVGRRAATLGGLLFAVHPVGSLVAGAIAFRSESLVALALFGLIVAHRRGRPVWAGVCVLVAGLSKETGLVLAPLYLAALEIAAGRPPVTKAERPVRRGVFASEALLWFVALGLRLKFAPPWLGHFPDLSASEQVGTRLAALTKSVASVVVPIDARICDAFPISGASAPAALLGAAFALVLLVAARRGGAVGLLTVLSLLPSLQLVSTLRWWSPHYLYLAAAWFLVLVAERLVRRGAVPVALALVVTVVLGVGSWRAGRRYRSDESLWRAEVAAEPACREGQFYLAEVARSKEDFALAALHYEAALRSAPGLLAFVDLDATLTNYGLVLFRLGRLDEARRVFEEALQQPSDEITRRRVTHDLAAVALASGDAPRALELLGPELERADVLPESLVIGARALEALGRDREATELRARRTKH